MLSKEQKIEKLIELGGNRWTKAGKDRIYFNRPVFEKLLNIQTSYYNSGNLSGFWMDGEVKSNTQGNRILRELETGKFYYDIADDKFCYYIIYGNDIAEKLRSIIGPAEAEQN
ncbi:hypothetical protein SAMN02745136_00521 [Anaerocolumna jejuensis DSM 15929]|uniref:Uncharacterized protein n=1 Tax=Anaerocolumna jejuensis DSM 15929 TaxID=1121322 RepID=A0A1M6KNT7_9FIRM|nr:hypothetical protein [Anaerocolumna jejuensis]SHJ60556.1 hypothetical protein SAMN02745136_00521 [Anaerocolumna jejuensis DSM 15929]